jgi:uncharacterized protein with HEPN domain
MENEIKAWLSDIIKAINEINEFVPDKNDFHAFKNDLKTRRAIERNLEIIGEAVSRAVKKDPFLQITNARKIVDTRNRIIHGYDTVSVDILWAIIIRDLPNLENEIKFLLEE